MDIDYSYFDGELFGTINLCAEESHHLALVRRARLGQRVGLLNGRGGRALAVLEQASPKLCRLRVESCDVCERPFAPLWLAQALPLGKTMDSIVQKATELGAARILPISSERSEMRLDEERGSKKRQKWLSGAVEAVKQCGNPFLPLIDEPLLLSELLALELPPLRLVCSLREGARPLLACLPRDAAPSSGVVLAIGPEGDFSDREYDLFEQAGFLPVSLGSLVLRSDTAATAALSIVSAALRFAACPLSDNR